jgi:methylamine dehydrogenase heavy chain
MALSRTAERIFTVETFYSRGNRGTREDVLGVYDGRTLNLLKEIVLPGRLVAMPKAALFDVSEDGRLAYVYDMLPASAVHVVDLETGKVQTSVDLPGCALAFPYGARGFASICGDGTVGVVQVPQTGPAQVAFSKPFFQPDVDPLFEAGVVDRASGQGWMLSYSGKVFPVHFGAAAVIDKPWSVTAAAELPPAGTGVQELAWRPGGSGRMFALHDSSSTLYVLMHAGNHWTAKEAGTEVWVLDAANQKLIRRVKLETPAQGIAVSQDAAPLLYVMGQEHKFYVLDGKSGAVLRKRKLSGVMAWVPGN